MDRRFSLKQGKSVSAKDRLVFGTVHKYYSTSGPLSHQRYTPDGTTFFNERSTTQHQLGFWRRRRALHKRQQRMT